MLETSYTLNLGQLFKIALKLKRYLWHKLKPKKTQNLNITTIEKQVSYLVPHVGIAIITIDNHMAIIQVHIEKNNVSHGLQFSKLLGFSSIIFLNNNDLNPYKLLSNNY
jgi:hypothetical protein